MCVSPSQKKTATPISVSATRSRTVRRRDPGKKGVPRIGRDDAALALLPIERQRIGRQFLAPERRLEPLTQGFGFGFEASGAARIAERARENGGMPLRGEDVALHLTQRNRPRQRVLRQRGQSSPPSPSIPG